MNRTDYLAVLPASDLYAEPLCEGNREQVIDWLRERESVVGLMVYTKDLEAYFTATEFLKGAEVASTTIPLMSPIYNMCVPKFYKMDPETEDLVVSGHSLANGMKVLTGESRNRARVEEHETDWVMDRLLTNNRWCTVTHLSVEDDLMNTIHFLGVYEDGDKRMRVASATESWLVKKDSVTESMIQSTERYSTVQGSVREAVENCFKILADEDISDDDKAFRIAQQVDSSTRRVLGLL